MQTTADMSSATAICDHAAMGVSCDGGSRGRAAPDCAGDGTQTRFAEVLPLARAALDQSSEPGEQVQGRTKGELDGVQVCEDAPASPDGPARKSSKAQSSTPETVVWAPAEIVQPVIQPQAQTVAPVAQPATTTADGLTTESAQFAPELAEGVLVMIPPHPEASTSRFESIPVVASGQLQVRGNEQPVDAAAGDALLECSRAIPPVEGSGKPAQPVSQTVPDDARSISLGERQIPSVSQSLRETVTVESVDIPQVAQNEQVFQNARTIHNVQTTQAVANAGRVEEAGIANAQTDAADMKDGRPRGMTDAQHGDAVPPAKVSQTPGTLRSASESEKSAVAGRTEQVSDRSVAPSAAAGADALARSEKVATEQNPLSDELASISGRPKAVSSESLKAEPARSGWKEASVTSVKDTAAIQPGQPASSGTEDVVLIQRIVTQTQAQTPTQPQMSADMSNARTPVQSVGEQILDSVQASAARGDRQVLVRLTPPELGTVLVRFQEQGEHLIGTLEVSSGETRREIEQALPQVLRTLQEAGVQVRRLEVVTSDQPERNSSHLAQDAWSQHQGTAQDQGQSHASGQTRWSQGWGEHGATPNAASEGESQSRARQGRLDLLL